ncbi:hypothetical protein PT276_10140 [Orbaceae bacterium ESL0721]|nr:hypothetical protein [Orbaceae bacterium ESL0721]
MRSYIITQFIHLKFINLPKFLNHRSFTRKKTEKKSIAKLLRNRYKFGLILTLLLIISPAYSAMTVTETNSLSHDTAFTSYSNKPKINELYSFKISKWFMVGDDWHGTRQFCNSRLSIGYRTPIVNDSTNGNSWNEELTWQANSYKSRIGGGLIAKWRNINGEVYSGKSFDQYTFSAIDPNSNKHRSVELDYGKIDLYEEDYDKKLWDYICITL